MEKIFYTGAEDSSILEQKILGGPATDDALDIKLLNIKPF